MSSTTTTRRPRGCGKSRAVESEENQKQVFLPSHRPWKSRTTRAIPTFPTAPTAAGIYQTTSGNLIVVDRKECLTPDTEAGWLILSHGVGPLRTYCIGAFLLDRDNPGKVIGRLHEPLLRPDQEERKGYVPNVVYTCGALLHKGELIIPYGMADHATGFATVPLDEVLAAMQ